MQQQQQQADLSQMRDLKAYFSNEKIMSDLELSITEGSRVDEKKLVDLFVAYCRRNPTLLGCSKLSLLEGLKFIAQCNLEPLLGQVYIVPFKNNKKDGIMEAQVIIGYSGYCELMYRSGEVELIEVHLVHDCDLKPPGKFELVQGDEPKITHLPNWQRRTAKSPILGAYSVIFLKNGRKSRTFMTNDEIQEIRKRSKARDSGPWVTDPGEMSRKTVLKRARKYLRISVSSRVNDDFDDEESIPNSMMLPGPSAPAPAPATSDLKNAAPEAQAPAAGAPAAPTGTAAMTQAIEGKRRRGRPRKAKPEPQPQTSAEPQKPAEPQPTEPPKPATDPKPAATTKPPADPKPQKPKSKSKPKPTPPAKTPPEDEAGKSEASEGKGGNPPPNEPQQSNDEAAAAAASTEEEDPTGGEGTATPPDPEADPVIAEINTLRSGIEELEDKEELRSRAAAMMKIARKKGASEDKIKLFLTERMISDEEEMKTIGILSCRRVVKDLASIVIERIEGA